MIFHTTPDGAWIPVFCLQIPVGSPVALITFSLISACFLFLLSPHGQLLIPTHLCEAALSEDLNLLNPFRRVLSSPLPLLGCSQSDCSTKGTMMERLGTRREKRSPRTSGSPCVWGHIPLSHPRVTRWPLQMKWKCVYPGLKTSVDLHSFLCK